MICLDCDTAFGKAVTPGCAAHADDLARPFSQPVWTCIKWSDCWAQ
jgi:hypothetical protein